MLPAYANIGLGKRLATVRDRRIEVTVAVVWRWGM
jgi:hypothetical protein